jgi:hypothetical protein
MKIAPPALVAFMLCCSALPADAQTASASTEYCWINALDGRTVPIVLKN